MIGVSDNDLFEKELARLTGKTSSNSNGQVVPNQVVDDSDKNETNEKVVNIEHGRTLGRSEIPQEVRALIAGEVISGARADDVAKAFGISPSSISAYKNGATSTSSYNNPDEELSELNDATRRRIVGPAQRTLIEAIESITKEKLTNSKANVASAVARDMGSIIKNMQPEVGSVINNNQVVIYKPRMKEEDEYIAMQVND